VDGRDVGVTPLNEPLLLAAASIRCGWSIQTWEGHHPHRSGSPHPGGKSSRSSSTNRDRGVDKRIQKRLTFRPERPPRGRMRQTLRPASCIAAVPRLRRRHAVAVPLPTKTRRSTSRSSSSPRCRSTRTGARTEPTPATTVRAPDRLQANGDVGSNFPITSRSTTRTSESLATTPVA